MSGSSLLPAIPPSTKPPTARFLEHKRAEFTVSSREVPATSRALPLLAVAPAAASVPPLALGCGVLLLLLFPALAVSFQASFGGVCTDTRSPLADSHALVERPSWIPWPISWLARSGGGCLPGWEGPCCDVQEGYSDGEFLLRRIRNDEVELELPLAAPPTWSSNRSASYPPPDASDAAPEDFSGLWWLDQRLRHKAGMAEHPGYVEEAVAVQAAEELVRSRRGHRSAQG